MHPPSIGNNPSDPTSISHQEIKRLLINVAIGMLLIPALFVVGALSDRLKSNSWRLQLNLMVLLLISHFGYAIVTSYIVHSEESVLLGLSFTLSFILIFSCYMNVSYQLMPFIIRDLHVIMECFSTNNQYIELDNLE